MLRNVLFAVLLNVPVTLLAYEVAGADQLERIAEPADISVFVRGDVNGDGELGMNDALAILQRLYGGARAFDCDDAADFNDNGVLEMADALGILNFLYAGKAPPASVRPGELEADTTPDALGCSRMAPTAGAPAPVGAIRPAPVRNVGPAGYDKHESQTSAVVKVTTEDVGYDVLVDLPDIVYRQGSNLTTMQHDGSDKFAIGQSGLEPEWSPEGQRIAYVHVYDIYTVNRDGSDRKRLTNDGSLYRDREPSWSPDGQKIVFVRDGNLHVITLGSDGTTASMRWITSATTGGAVDSAPAWSPDGSRIAFIREDDGRRELYFVDPDGSGVTQKTNTPEDEHDPDWHPNGRGIVLSVTDGGSDHNVRFISYAGFFAFAVDILTNGGLDDRSPSFSPDGTRIVFQRRVHGFNFRTDIYTCDLNGEQQINLTNLSGDTPASLAEAPDWR